MREKQLMLMREDDTAEARDVTVTGWRNAFVMMTRPLRRTALRALVGCLITTASLRTACINNVMSIKRFLIHRDIFYAITQDKISDNSKNIKIYLRFFSTIRLGKYA